MILFTFSVQHVRILLFILYCVVLCTLVSSTISAFKKIYTSKFASKLRNFVTIWLYGAFLCFLLNRLWLQYGIFIPENMQKDTLFMFLSYVVTKI